MANVSITLSGITQAIEELNYRQGSVKQKAITAIQSFYTSEEALQELQAIDTDTLVKMIWDVGDDVSRIRSKRRNFSSLKSSINSDLKKLVKKGLNQENIVIADANIFDMTEEAKNNLLHSFTDAVKTGDINLAKATDILKAVTDFLDEIDISVTQDESVDIISEIKKVLSKLGGHILEGEGEDAVEEVEIDEDEEIEEIEIDEDEDLEEIELDEDEDIEEIELDEDEDIEEIELDEDEELEEVDELDEDIEEVELGEDEEIEEVEFDEDEDLEEIELDEDEDIEEIELDEDEDIEEIELDEDEDVEEIELDEDEELEEVDELDEEELQALEDFRNARELAEHFDDTLGEREKKFNAYIKIPEGTYTVGTKKALKASLELQQFEMPLVYMAKYPVTNALFEIFIEQTGYVTTAEKKGFGVVYSARYEKKGNTASWNKQAGSKDVKGACWYQPTGPGSTLHEKRNHPVVQVSVEDALAYTSWIGRRLPTEAEWESAARTDLGFKFPWGNQFDPQGLNIEKTGISDTSPVDTYDAFANEFGMADMLGNVMEWTSDSERPPFKTRDKRRYNVAKGGAWNAGQDITISSRGLYRKDFTSNTIGFRCISELFQ
ncbi:MAG: formylglycine-generating enzyme family protein [Desulfobacterales bacterium]|nr:formylglycine-generating enzyme family protein [Desulfobacterales bacterium]